VTCSELHSSTLADLLNYRERHRVLDRAVDSSMTRSGYYKYEYKWHKRGVTTMRGLGALGGITNALKREKARRFLDELEPEERDRYIEQNAVDVEQLAIEELISRIFQDPAQQELQLRRLTQLTDELAGPAPEPVVKLLAKTCAVMLLERNFADFTFRTQIGERGGLTSKFARAALEWRDFADRKVQSNIRTLAYVRHLDINMLKDTVSRFKIAG
jgi:hypothetical protein